ncbi:MAG: DNA polymerase/3'-5' exonuclease PolX [Planctomycetales bacterium]|nr:DNA polymerase/3'-5' exonuclease PolX [Planctomycetales bacterium]NIM09798.1 DNA polymerase/3'-5' exonuclease PolX [Planctomycetales bacterium]NIN09267.1 DNA polymerase/3'-5' exonuclease PolX [Planctomycetales bacterium]NIN78370.1 DNA polymerase/3'-5' exonuclease PolX [Planctomycetales bacterium]NIO35546.1 DNA polymerase/3'-5' exonuclease PolX [Planctomycetales bacterium]
MTNAQIADTFDQIADLLEFEGANPFRIRAYRNGSRVVRDLTESAATIIADPNRDLTQLEGIGKDLAEKVATLVRTGGLPMLTELLERVPESVLALLRIPHLGPKKAAALFHQLHIQTLDQLRAACEAGEVQRLKGFGAKSEQDILKGIPQAAQAADRLYWAQADEIAAELLAHMKTCPEIHQIQMAGSYRRGRETVHDLDVLVDATHVAAVMDHLGAFSGVREVIVRGETKMAVRLQRGFQIDLRVVPAESFGAALQHFTGSKAHNIVLRGMAKDRGLKINEYGVFRGRKRIAGRTEEEVYAALDLPWFPPELRENREEFNWAAKGKLPALIELTDIRGDLHMHTTETDGKNTLEEMVAAARQRGLKYIAITDHSKRVTMANGLDAKRLRKQWKAIDRLNQQVQGIRVLKGIELDILEDGRLDLPDDVLAEADWVVCSIHYGQNQPREKITERLLGAIEHPNTSAIAHPTGRLINRRQPYDVDLEAVMRAAAKHKKLLELNANPMRLDLDDVACAAAKAHGVYVVLGTDAHSAHDLDKMRYGILQARRGGLTKADVANTRTWPQMKKLIGR